MDSIQPRLDEFESVRYNTQIRWGSKGEANKVSKADYKPGLYFVSKFQPMLQSTRGILSSCWRSDCLLVHLLTGYWYSSCPSSKANLSTIASAIISGSLSHYLEEFNSTISTTLIMNASNHLTKYYRIAQLRTENCIDHFSDRIESASWTSASAADEKSMEISLN